VASAKAASRKLSFKDKHALETLPGRIAGLEREVVRLNAVLADPDLYARQPGRFAEATKALEDAQAALGEAEEQWLALEMLREELEGA
jgi:ATP-binding cassette subfamily F protein uup